MCSLVTLLGCSRDVSDADEPNVPPDPPVLAIPGEPTPGPQDSFYTKVRSLDLRGTGATDSVVGTASGSLPDSVSLELRFYVDGRVAYSEGWRSSYELTDRDSLRARPELIWPFLVQRLDRSLESVTLEPYDSASASMMSNDREAMARITPKPTKQVSFIYGYESSVAMAFDSVRGQFVVLWTCC